MSTARSASSTSSDLSSAPIMGIAGWKKSGKTTLTTRLIEELTKRGYRVASVKHAHHDFQVDTAETDSARHRRAGAREVAIVSPERFAVIGELAGGPEPPFAEVISWLGPSDIILVEGYKAARIPKIEARRRAAFAHEPLADQDEHVVAIAADEPVSAGANARGLPVFDLSDIAGITDFIVAYLRLPARGDNHGA